MNTDRTAVTPSSSSVGNRRIAASATGAVVVILVLTALLARVGGYDPVANDGASSREARPGTEATNASDGGSASDNAEAPDGDQTANGHADGESAGGLANDDVSNQENLEVDLLVGESGEGAAGDSSSLDAGGVEPADPCDSLAPGRSLLVVPDPVVLAPTVMASHLVVTNCGDGSIAWTALTVPKVDLGLQGGTLAAGAVVELPFTIDEGAIATGAFDFKIKVSEPGANTYVDVHAFKGIIKVAQLPNPAFTAGPNAGGCSQQCITKAQLTPAAGTANLDLAVTTTVPATLKVWVSSAAPVWNNDVPSFPGTSPIAAHPALVTQRNLTLAPLEGSTGYHIIVEATDGNDHRAYRVGQFTTVAPAVINPTLAPNHDSGGCASQCITKALVTSSAGTTDASLQIKTVVPAALKVFVSEHAPTQHGAGTPYFPGSSPVASTNGELTSSWTAQLKGLASDTTYHVIVVAVDGEGRSAYRTGTFTTHHVEHTLRVTFHRIHVISDGDGGSNPGELTFRMGTGQLGIGTTSEKKIGSGTILNLNGTTGVTHTIHGVSGHIPTIWVEAYERDGIEKNSCVDVGFGVTRRNSDWGHWDQCNQVWNTAANGIVALDQFDTLHACSELLGEPVAAAPNDRCIILTSAEPGPGFPVLEVLVSLRLVD